MQLNAVKKLAEPLLVFRRRLRRSFRRLGTPGGLLSFAPLSVQRWVHTQRNVRAVREGHRLVPEGALERKFVEALNFLTKMGGPAAQLGDYLEFGVYNGSSLACMYRALNHVGATHVRLFGFDSFEGLPPGAEADDEGNWLPGQYSMDYKFTRKFLTQQGVDWNRVFLVKGWFQDTLNEALIHQHAIEKASVIMVDCDTYSSAKEALSFSAPLIKDFAIVLFDDWFAAEGRLAERNLGEKRAFDEFLAEHLQFSAEEFGHYGANSKVFVVSRTQ